MESVLPDGIVERLLDNLKNKSKSIGDDIHSRLVADYVSPERYDLELGSLFRRLPIVACHSSQLPGPGDFIRHDRLGMPIVITRKETGELAAFRNICSHRAATVETEKKGNCRHFICPYHHWTFSLDGTLKHVPDETSFNPDEFDSLALKPITVAEKYGLVFVRLEGDFPIDIDQFLGEFAPELKGLKLEHHTFFSERDTDLRCNWKVMMEGSLEVYHFKFLHAQSAAGQFLPMSAIFDNYSPHQRHIMPRKDFPQRVKESNDPRRAVLPNYYIFPNTVLTFPHDHMTLTQVFPTALGQCVFYNALLTLDKPGENKSRDYWLRALDYTQTVNQEDFDAVESVQRSYQYMAHSEQAIHGRFELGISRFHQACDRLLEGDDNAFGQRLEDDQVADS